MFFFVENLCKINTLVTKLLNETYVHYHGNISEQVTKLTQTKTKYYQFSRLLQPIYYSKHNEGLMNL